MWRWPLLRWHAPPLHRTARLPPGGPKIYTTTDVPPPPARSRTASEVALGGALLPMPVFDPPERLPTALKQVDVSAMLRAERGE